MSSDIAFREAAKSYLLIATIDWDWGINDDVAGTVALTGMAEGLLLETLVDLKEEIEKHLAIRRNDTIYLAYDFLAHSEISKDAEGRTMQTVTEYVVPRFIINAVTGKAVQINNVGGEF
jgi:hypothetical protein